MRLLERWLSELSPLQRTLDLGCGAGSLRVQLAHMTVIGVDLDPKQFSRNRDLPGVCAESHCLPFASRSFDLVVCHHSLEHFRDLPGTVAEISRVLKPGGRLFVSVPDGDSFSDHLYRFLLCGGGHLQRFSFHGVVSAVESGTGLHLTGWKELYASFTFVNKQTFLPSPRGPLPGPLPRRMRWLGHLPRLCFDAARLSLNIATRLMDRCFSTRLSQYGWALAFGPEAISPQTEAACWNVCMSCGAAIDEAPDESVGRLLYRCPYCSHLNVLFSNDRS